MGAPGYARRRTRLSSAGTSRAGANFTLIGIRHRRAGRAVSGWSDFVDARRARSVSRAGTNVPLPVAWGIDDASRFVTISTDINQPRPERAHLNESERRASVNSIKPAIQTAGRPPECPSEARVTRRVRMKRSIDQPTCWNIAASRPTRGIGLGAVSGTRASTSSGTQKLIVGVGAVRRHFKGR